MENNQEQELTRKEILEKEAQRTKKIKRIITYSIISILVLFTIFTLYNFKSIEKEQNQNLAESLANCLSNKEVVMYGTEWCGLCKKQKELFGDSFSKINYLDCDKSPQICIDAGVQAYPSWKINNQIELGYLGLDLLKDLSGC
jgi:thiol-disulfide isomerase/thioredoxin